MVTGVDEARLPGRRGPGAAAADVATARAAALGPPSPDTVDRWARLAGDERIELMALLVEAHARLTRVLGAELEARTGLPLSWYDVLVRLASAPDRRLTMSKVADCAALTSGGVTRLVDRMEEAGVVERHRCPSDRRSVHVALTEAGSAALDAATAEHLEGLDRHLMAPLDARDRLALARALRKLRGTGCG